MVRPPIGSTSAVFGVSSAACSSDWSGVLSRAAASKISSSTGAASTDSGYSKDIAIVGAGFVRGGYATVRIRSAFALLLAARATRLDIQPACFQSPQAFFQVSKLLISIFKHSLSHSARNSSPNAEFTTSSSTKCMLPDKGTFPCGCQTGSYCTGP